MKTIIFTRLLAASLIVAVTTTAFTTKDITASNNLPGATTLATNAGTISRNAATFILANILNQNLTVTYARDGGTDITEEMNDWKFRFVGNPPAGEAQAWNDLFAQTGTWNMAEGSYSINISYNSGISQLVFMSRQWAIGGMNRGPEIVLTAPDGDEVHLISDMQ